MERKIGKKAETSMRLEYFLKTELGLSAHQIRRAKYRENGICVNGERRRIDHPVETGDLVEVLLEEEREESAGIAGQAGAVHILYEDADLLVVDKEAGIAVHPAHGHYSDTLANRLAYRYREQGIGMVIRPVGRLDKETSGCILFAKNKLAAARLSGKEGNVHKEYLALAEGFFDCLQGTITKPIRKMPGQLNRMETVKDGEDPDALRAVTHYRVWKQYRDFAVLQLQLETGRTHQIRVHMASEGHPLLGDELYGGKGRMIRAALHCRTVEILHPITEEWIRVEASIPEDIKVLLETEIES